MFDTDTEVMFGDRGGAVGLTAVRAPMVKPPSWRTYPGARALLEVMLLLMTRRAIDHAVDDTVELSMKAPMSVSKPADLG